MRSIRRPIGRLVRRLRARFPLFSRNSVQTNGQHQPPDKESIYWDESYNQWMLTDYADIRALLRSQETVQTPILEGGNGIAKTWLSFLNPPDHTHLRSWLNQAFLPQKIERLRPQIQLYAEQLIDRVQAAGRMDLVTDYANALSPMAMAEFLRLPIEDYKFFTPWLQTLPGILELNPTPENIGPVDQAIANLRDYFSGIVERRRDDLQDDPISLLLTFEGPSGRLSQDELVANSILLLWGGQITSSHMIANGVLTLLQHPEHYLHLQQSPDLVEQTVEELLRYLSPVPALLRCAGTDMYLADKPIAKGQMLCPSLAAANHDPSRFSHPERFDPTRVDNPHMAFGYGTHHCIGAILARLIMQVGIGTISRRLPNLTLQKNTALEVENIHLQGLKSLPVTF